MAIKRKRNVKIDNQERYIVVNQGELDPAYIEEFTLPPIDSGMEAEEEKEVHLKNIIVSGKGDIPIPNIEIVENPASSCYEKIELPTKYIKWNSDVKNEYCIDDVDRKLCEELGIDEQRYLEVVNKTEKNYDAENETERIIRNTIMYKRLIREENNALLSYVCFRRRIITPSRKNRRSESQTTEKLTKLITELETLNYLFDLSLRKNKIEETIIDLDFNISLLISNIVLKYGDKARKKLREIIKGTQANKDSNGSSMQYDLFHNILFDRNKIRVLKKRISNARKHINEGEIDKEAKAYFKYLNKHEDKCL